MVLDLTVKIILSFVVFPVCTNLVLSAGKTEVRRKYRHCPLVLHEEWDRFFYDERPAETAVFYLEVVNNGEFRDSDMSRMVMKAMPPTLIGEHMFRVKALDAMRGRNVGSEFPTVVESIRKGVKEQRRSTHPGFEKEDELDWINRSFKEMRWWERPFWDQCVRDYRMLRYIY